MTDEIRKLLGGYASGTLTEEEREQLYQAALEDPAVFEAMAEEQPLRDLLDDPSARAELLAAVQDRPFSMTAALRDWFERPKSKVLVALGVVALAGIGVKQMTEIREQSLPREVARVLRPAEPSGQFAQEQSARQPAPVAEPLIPAPKPAPFRRKTAEPPLPAADVQPQAQAAAPPPPPPAAAEMPKPAPAPAATPVVILTWTVQHNAPGKAHVSIQSKQEGTLLARQAGEVLYAGAISPGIPVSLDRDITADPVEVEFAPGPVSPELTGGVVGGVPRAAVTALRSGVVISPVPPPVRLRIDLREIKNP